VTNAEAIRDHSFALLAGRSDQFIRRINRCRYKGSAEMKRCVGVGVVPDNLINIGRVMEKQSRQG
jgi:hypothetical protein